MSNAVNKQEFEDVERDNSRFATIMLLVIIAISILIVFLLYYRLSKKSGNNPSADSSAESVTSTSISMEDAVSYSTGGITFAIPSNYEQSESLTISENSTIILGNEALDHLWVSYFLSESVLYEKIDELAVSMVPDAKRLSSETTYIDGIKTFLYTYTGTMEEKQYYAHVAMILNTNNNHVVYAVYVTPYDSGRDIADFKALLAEAKETGDDSSGSSKRVYYVEN